MSITIFGASYNNVIAGNTLRHPDGYMYQAAQGIQVAPRGPWSCFSLIIGYDDPELTDAGNADMQLASFNRIINNNEEVNTQSQGTLHALYANYPAQVDYCFSELPVGMPIPYGQYNMEYGNTFDEITTPTPANVFGFVGHLVQDQQNAIFRGNTTGTKDDQGFDANGDSLTDLVGSLYRTFYDDAKPIVVDFLIPPEWDSTTVPICTLDSDDSVAVTGWLLKETASVPTANDAAWVGTKPTQYTFASTGSKRLFAFVKDGDGNVSFGVEATTTIGGTRSATTRTTNQNGDWELATWKYGGIYYKWDDGEYQAYSAPITPIVGSTLSYYTGLGDYTEAVETYPHYITSYDRTGGTPITIYDRTGTIQIPIIRAIDAP